MSVESFNSQGNNIERGGEQSSWDDLSEEQMVQAPSVSEVSPVESQQEREDKISRSREAVLEAAESNPRSEMVNNAVENHTAQRHAQGKEAAPLGVAIEAGKQYEQGYSVYVPDSTAKSIGGAVGVRQEKLRNEVERLQEEYDEKWRNNEFKGFLGNRERKKMKAEIAAINARIDPDVDFRKVPIGSKTDNWKEYGRKQANNLAKVLAYKKELGSDFNKRVKRAEKQMGAKLPHNFNDLEGMKNWTNDKLESLAADGQDIRSAQFEK